MRAIREPVNFYTHALPALLAIPACVLIYVKAQSPAEIVSGFIYSGCAFLLFLISAVYHGFSGSEKGLRFLQKCDHCCIYLMIAGTYTPTSLLVFAGWIKWALLAVVWAIAATGCILKIRDRLLNERVSLALYISMGCLIVPLISQMLSVLPLAAIWWMLLGGVFYIGGTYFYYQDRPCGKRFHTHEIWHVFVVLGALSHFIYIYYYLLDGKHA